MIFGYADAMASERMMQAIGALERSVSRLEQDVARALAAPRAATGRVDVPAAREALRSLDSLIAELKTRTDG